MQISNNYVAVEKLEESKQEGFQTIQPQDSFIFKGKVVQIPEAPVYLGNRQIVSGDIIVFAKYSPSSHDISELKLKFIHTQDILCVL